MLLTMVVMFLIVPLGIWAAVVLSRPAKPARPLRATEVHFPTYPHPYPRRRRNRRPSQSLPFGWTPGQATMVGLGAASLAHMIHEHHESERIQAYWNTERINDYYDFGHHHD